MYTIIGGDGREYGPVTADQIRQWMLAGRANLDSQAKAAGSDDWRPLRDFPELMSGGHPADIPPGLGAAGTATTAASVAHAFDPLDCFSRAWTLLRANFWELIGVTLLMVLISAGIEVGMIFGIPNPANPHPTLADLGASFGAMGGRMAIAILIMNPFQGGYFYYLLRKARGEDARLSDLFAGFTRAWPQLVVSNLLVTIFLCVAFCCLVLPAFYVAIAYSLTSIVLIDRRCGPWAGMELSRRSVTRRWWSMFLLVILCVIVTIAGACALFVGVFVALPVCAGALVYAYLSLINPSEKRSDEGVASTSVA